MHGMLRRSVHYANYSLIRIRGWALLCVMAVVGVGVGAAAAAADLALVGTLGLGGFDSTAGTHSAMQTLAAFGITLAVAVVVMGGLIWVSDRAAPLMARTRDDDRLNSRWGLRWVAISFAMVPLVFVFVVLALMALGLDVNG
jgi:uncharacterized membrane protein YidH (DUF202 family)